MTTYQQNENCPVDHPSHYNQFDVEVIDMMERIWGTDAVISFCMLNAFKYKMRAGNKGGHDDLIKDLEKAEWYIKNARSLKTI